MLLYKNIQHIAILINCTPKIMTFAIDGDKCLIKEPCITQVSLSMPYFIGAFLTEFKAPLANGFIGDNNTPSSKDFFDITKAQSKAEVHPHRMADDLGRILIT
jgi:hypothetical protein